VRKQWIVFATLLIFIGLLGSISLFAAENEPENPDCTAGTEFCEQNSLDTTNNTTTNNTNVNTNNNTNTSTSTATNTNNNNNTSTSTATNTNNNNNTSTNANTNVNTSTATTTATTSNTNQNNNTNVNTSTSNSTVTSTVNQSVASTSTTDNTNTSVNTSTSTSDNTNTNVNQSTSESNVKTDNTNTNVNQSTTENTNRNINESSSIQRIEQDIKSEAPPASAIAPSIMSYSQDLCTTGRSGAFQGQMFGISGGSTVTDENCERLKLSKYVFDMGMKVAALSILCQDPRVFKAMEMAGTPCPYYGKIGKEAALGWQENRIERPDYEEEKAMFLKKCALDKNPKDSGYRKDVVSGVRKVFTKKNKTAKQCKREWQNAS
jgi:DNA polymerase III alpha subunit (gram-positive type)